MRGPRPAPGVLLALLALLGGACGKKGAILPPIPLVPQAVEGLRAEQRGGRILFEWTNPSAYRDGTALGELAAIEIWEGDTPADFPDAARLIRVLGAEELAALKKSADLKAGPSSFAIPLDGASLPGRSRALALRVKDVRKKRFSEFSTPVLILTTLAPLPPSNLRAALFEDRIALSWILPSSNIDGSAPPNLGGFNIYRAEGEEAFRRLNDRPVRDASYIDKDFEFGKVYRFCVRAFSAGEAAAESEDSPIVEAAPRDVFPPAVPTGLAAAAGGMVITLLWDGGRETDLSGFKVWRREGGRGGYSLLTPVPIPGNTFADPSAKKGKRYEYAVSALDKTGNESARSVPVAEILKEDRHEMDEQFTPAKAYDRVSLEPSFGKPGIRLRRLS